MSIQSKLLWTIFIPAFLMTLSTGEGTCAVRIFEADYTYHASELDSVASCKVLAQELAVRKLAGNLADQLIDLDALKNRGMKRDDLLPLLAGSVSVDSSDDGSTASRCSSRARLQADPEELAATVLAVRSNGEQAGRIRSNSLAADRLLQELEQLKQENRGTPEPAALNRYTDRIIRLHALSWIIRGNLFFTKPLQGSSVSDKPDAAGELAARNALYALGRALESIPGMSAPHLQRAFILQYVLRDYAGALKEYDAAIAKNSWNVEGLAPKPLSGQAIDAVVAGARAERAYCLLRTGKLPEALVELSALLAQNPDRVGFSTSWRSDDIADLAQAFPKEASVYALRSAFADERGETEGRDLKDARKAVALEPGNPVYLYRLARKLSESGADNGKSKIDEAQKLLDKALALTASKHLLRRLHALKAERYAQQQDTTAALREYDAAIAAEPDFADSYVAKGLLFELTQDNPVRAIVEYTRAITAPRHAHWGLADIYRVLARAYVSLGQHEMAAGSYLRSLSESDTAASGMSMSGGASCTVADDTAYRLGKLYVTVRKYEDALLWLNRAITGCPGGSAFEQRAYAYQALGKPEEAVRDFTAALQYFNAGDANLMVAAGELLTKRGFVYLQNKKYHEAIRDFDQALTRYRPSFSNSDDYLYRGMAYHYLGQPEKAIADYTKGLELQPKDATLYAYRAAAYLNALQYPKALDDLNAAIKLNPKQDEAYYYRCVLYDTIGNLQQRNSDCVTAARLGNRQAQEFVRNYGGDWKP